MADEEDIEDLDEEEEDEDEEGEEGDEEGEEEEGEEEGNDEENALKQKEVKQKTIQSDIATIKDIFQYIDRCTNRITQRMQMSDTIESLRGNNQLQQRLGGGGGEGGNANQQAPWSNYENLTESERAELLERALLVLASDEYR